MAVQEDVNVACVVSNTAALQSSFLPTINNGIGNRQTLIPQSRVVVASQGGKQNLSQVRFVHTIPANGSNQPQIVRLVKNIDGTNNLTPNIYNVRGPLSSPIKGAVINFPVSAKVLTNSTKLKVGDTITIPKSQIVNENHVNISTTGLHTTTPSTPTKLLSSISQSPQPSASHNEPAHSFMASQSPYNLHEASPARLPTVAQSWPHTQSPMRPKRSSLFMDSSFPQSETKRRRTPTCGEKGNKGLRHFAMLVCEKVKQKVTTTYNEVADELVADYTESQKRHILDQAYDQKNIRRRVYDALNVLMAMDIIYKDKKDIHWVGLPTNSAQEVQTLMSDKKKREQRIQQKNLQLQELILQQIAFKNLVQRNKRSQELQGPPPENSSIQLPFIIVNTSKKTVIDCSISNDKYEYMFNFNNTFEIHDDIEVLKRMGMAYGLESGNCTPENLKIAQNLVPPVLKPYIEQMAGLPSKSSSNEIPSLTYTIQDSHNRIVPKIKYEQCEISQVYENLAAPGNHRDLYDPDDDEVAMATDSEAPSSSSHSSGLRLVSLTPLSGSGGLESGSESRGSTPMDKSFEC